jgi:mannose-6-phosphate isomerase-like protein (cupin superfamily)
MARGRNSAVHVLPPGEGKSVWLVGDLVTVKLQGEDTGGAYSLVEETSHPGGGPPPHMHHDTDETFYVLEGEVELMAGDRTIPASAGTAVYIPKGTLHTFRNVGTSPSRILALLSPGGFEKFFLEAGEPAREGSSATRGEPDIGRIVRIGRKYGLEIPPPPGQ